MKAKKIMGVALLHLQWAWLIPCLKTDRTYRRSCQRELRNRRRQRRRRARKQELMNSVVEEGEVPVTVSPSISTPAISGSKKAELEAKRNKEAEAEKERLRQKR